MEGLRGFGKFIQNIDCVQIIRCSIHPPTVLVYWIISIKFKDFHIFRLHFYYFSAPFFTYFSIHLIYKLKKRTHLIHSLYIDKQSRQYLSILWINTTQHTTVVDTGQIPDKNIPSVLHSKTSKYLPFSIFHIFISTIQHTTVVDSWQVLL